MQNQQKQPPSILNTVKNSAVPKSRDIQQFSISQRLQKATNVSRRHRLVSNVKLVTLTSLSILPKGVASRVYEHVALPLTVLDLWPFETSIRLGSSCQKHYGSLRVYNKMITHCIEFTRDSQNVRGQFE